METQTQQLLDSPISIIGIFQTTKEQRHSFVTQVIDSVINGTVNPLELHRNIKCMEEIIKSINAFPEYKEALLEEAEKYESKTFDYGNSKITIKEVGTKYDFTACNDLEWNALKEKEESIKAELKAKETVLKAIQKPMIVTDAETGETYEVLPATKTSTTSIAVTLK